MVRIWHDAFLGVSLESSQFIFPPNICGCNKWKRESAEGHKKSHS